MVKASISLFWITKEFGTKTLKDLAIKIGVELKIRNKFYEYCGITCYARVVV